MSMLSSLPSSFSVSASPYKSVAKNYENLSNADITAKRNRANTKLLSMQPVFQEALKNYKEAENVHASQDILNGLQAEVMRYANPIAELESEIEACKNLSQSNVGKPKEEQNQNNNVSAGNNANVTGKKLNLLF